MKRASNIERILAAAAVFTGSAAVFLVAYFNPVTAGFFPVCPLYSMTGLHCPGCGLTRGFHALFHGDVLSALHFNAFVPVYFLLFAYLGISLFLIAARGRGLPLKFVRPGLAYGFLTLLLVFGVVRNLPYYPFTFLAPQ
ncbi:MAG: DUF2752 domain-containing protein [Pyrinomonadaceae bacterium]